jgi:putative DNA primase/helicase
MVERYREDIDNNLRQHDRHWGDVARYLDGMPDFALWRLNNPRRSIPPKTIQLALEEWPERTGETRKAIFARVERSIRRAYVQASRAAAKAAPIETTDHKPIGMAEAFRALLDPDEKFGASIEETDDPPHSVVLVVAPPGSRKSTLIREYAVRFVTEHPGKTVVIFVPTHKLGAEQIRMLRAQHPNAEFTAAIWRGRHAINPDDPDLMPMCRRSEEVKGVEKTLLNVERSMCKRGRGKKTVKCKFYDDCAFQKQKQQMADIWFAAHECAVHETPEAWGDVGWVIFDEDPRDAFMFGLDIDDPVTLGLDKLGTPLKVDPAKLGGRHHPHANYNQLSEVRRSLYDRFDKTPISMISIEAPVPRCILTLYLGEIPQNTPKIFVGQLKLLLPYFHYNTIHNLTWRGKVDPDIRPDMSPQEVKSRLQTATVNSQIKKETILWKLIGSIDDNEFYGRIMIQHGSEGRVICMTGVQPPRKKLRVPTLICDATGDAELLRAIFPQITEAKPHGWEQLPRPPGVRIIQCVNDSFSKKKLAIEGKDEKDRERRTTNARRLYAAVMMKALEYGGADVGVIVYKSTKEWIRKNCSVPDWLKLLHWGDVNGTNDLEHVRALFVIGRPLPSAEDVTRQAEALFGAYIPERDYVERQKQGRIPIVTDAAGNNCVRVDVREHPHPMAERLRRQITEGAIIQAIGRARAGLRKSGEPIDLHLWADVPVPELGPVEPVLLSEIDAGLDGLMLATKGCWLAHIADAVRAFEGLFSAEGLRTARGAGWIEPAWDRMPVMRAKYQRAGVGCKIETAVFLRGFSNPRGFLEKQLGPLSWFCEVGVTAGGGVRSS